jgi:aminopeptidase N
MRSSSRLRHVFAAAAVLGGIGCGAPADITRSPPPEVAKAPEIQVPAPLATGRLPGTAVPLRYSLSLVVDPAKSRFSGDVTIDVDVPRATRAIVLHGQDLSIERAAVMVSGEAIRAEPSLRSAAGSKEGGGELVLWLPRPIGPGKAQIRISYSAPFGEKLIGLYRVEEGGQAYAFTQFEPVDARRAFPCFDEPGFKVPFDLQLTIPKGQLAVANTEEVKREESGDGRSVTFTFAPTPPLPTYLVAIAVGPLEVREGPRDPIKIRLITTKGKAKMGDLALEAAGAFVKLLGEYFDRPYPYAKLDLVGVPEFAYGAMENAGLITFRESLLLLDPASASIAARRDMALTIAHEISHHWFGNLVTMTWWDDLWLNEGFATWMEAKLVDMWRPAMGASLENVAAKAWVMELDALGSAQAVRQPVVTVGDIEDGVDGLVFVKGAIVVGMLETWLGPDVFREGVRTYIKAHEHGNATSADLFEAMHRVSGKDVGAVVTSFLDRPGVPIVRARLRCEAKGATVELTQARHRRAPVKEPAPAGEDRPWTIPLCIAYEGAPGKAPACGVLERESLSIPLPVTRCPAFIYPNAGEVGYFRFALPPEGMTALAKADKALDVQSRLGLITNSWALVRSGDLGSDALFDLLAGMKRERHRLVMEQMIGTLHEVSRTLIEDRTRPAFRAFVSSSLLPLAKELGWDPRKRDTDDDKLLRQATLSALAGLTDEPWMKAEADKRATAYLRDPRSVDPNIAGIALWLSTRRAAEARFTELLGALRRAATPEDRTKLIRTLGSFADPNLLRRSLDLILSGEIRPPEALTIFQQASFGESLPVALGWLKDHFEELKQKLPGFMVTRFASALGGVCDKDARDAAVDFYSRALSGLDGGERPLQQALEKADLCIELRAREASRAAARLVGKKNPAR